MTWIERLEREGHRRIGTPRSGFRWVDVAGAPVSRAEQDRLRALRLPPAWTDVRASASPRTRVLAIGKDRKGRIQYRYHPAFRQRQEEAKFARLRAFAQALPAMRAAVARDLARPGLPREKVLACILRILATCFLRPGSQVYASENGSYGIATLRPEHVKVRGDVVRFAFPGKAGKWQVRELCDRRVAHTIRELLRVPGEEVFKFVLDDGAVVDVRRRHVNEYIKEVMGERFSAKDFRTWAGTLLCASALARAGPCGPGPRALRRRVAEAVKETAAVLGNTPAVCRSSYIYPGIISAYERGQVVQRTIALEELRPRVRGLHAGEQALLALLRGRPVLAARRLAGRPLAAALRSSAHVAMHRRANVRKRAPGSR